MLSTVLPWRGLNVRLTKVRHLSTPPPPSRAWAPSSLSLTRRVFFWHMLQGASTDRDLLLLLRRIAQRVLYWLQLFRLSVPLDPSGDIVFFRGIQRLIGRRVRVGHPPLGSSPALRGTRWTVWHLASGMFWPRDDCLCSTPKCTMNSSPKLLFFREICEFFPRVRHQIQ